jgi:hypothetical protein
LEDLDAKLKATSNPDELKKYNDQINAIIAEISSFLSSNVVA